MSTKLYKRTDLILQGIIITAGFWMIILIETVFGLGPMNPPWIPRWFFVGLTAVFVGLAWVILYTMSLWPKYEM